MHLFYIQDSSQYEEISKGIYQGVVPSIVNYLSDRLQFKYELIPYEANGFGLLDNKTNSWTGVIGKFLNSVNYGEDSHTHF